MTQSTPYKCKICGRPGVARYDDSCPINSLQAWVSMLAHDRCHDYAIARRRVERSISAVCDTILRTRVHDNFPDDVTVERAKHTVESARPILSFLTHRYADICCAYHHLQTIWEPDFPQQLLDHPDKSKLIMTTYVQGIKTLPRPKTA